MSESVVNVNLFNHRQIKSVGCKLWALQKPVCNIIPTTLSFQFKTKSQVKDVSRFKNEKEQAIDSGNDNIISLFDYATMAT